MTGLTIERFGEYFKALHDHDPYPWQERLARRVVSSDWPGAIDLPTGSGKTACIDIAVFALAAQADRPVNERTAPRRVFFCVNRRVIVDEAFERARRIAGAIREAENGTGVLADVAAALRIVARGLPNAEGNSQANDKNQGTPPLDVLELRGGIYRDNRWARSITQPTIICTTIDQLGSRLLFRGYGVSTNAAPIQAALIAYDSLILLDEAHISHPFFQTLQSVRQYLDPQKWAEHDEGIGVRSAVVVPMTATPTEQMTQRGVIVLDNQDRDVESLSQRLTASKPAELCPTKKIEDNVVNAALRLAEDTPVAVGIMVNRVATAKAVYTALLDARNGQDGKREIAPDAVIELVIGSMRPIDRDEQAKCLRGLVGSMRPIDRDEQAKRLHALVGPGRPDVTTKTSFIVATQCLEVGADYDFDVLITECASLDALRQRFGRLNRAGRAIEAKAVVLIDGKAVKKEGDIKKVEQNKDTNKRTLDPIYGNALARTWNWLNEHANEETIEEGTTGTRIDFGIDAFDDLLRQHGEDGRIPDGLLAPSASLNAPVMLPAYVDFWCQTAPRPVPDPDVSPFLHGPRRGAPDVQVCWRADLVEDDDEKKEPRKHWCDVVALLPPTSAECMSVPIGRLRTWLKESNAEAREKQLVGRADNDLQNPPDEEDENASRFQVDGVVWRGIGESKRLGELTKEDDLRPGDTIVLPVSAGGWNELGHIPGDCAARAEPAIRGEPRASETKTPDSRKNGATHTPDTAYIDVAEVAFRTARDRVALRLHPALRKRLPESDGIQELLARADDNENPPTTREWRTLLMRVAGELGQRYPLAVDMRKLADEKYGLSFERYPNGHGVVLTTRRRIGTASAWFLPPLDDGEDELSRTRRERPMTLRDHTRHVINALDGLLSQLPLERFVDALRHAVQWHDLGKADPRFQAMLCRTDRTDAWLLAAVSSEPLAKSDGLPMTRSDRGATRRRAGLPAGFRHEMLSMQLAERSSHLPNDPTERDLVLHLIAAHHGRARPFAPVVIDDDIDDPPPPVAVEGVEGVGGAEGVRGVGGVEDHTLAITTDQRLARPPHRLDSGIAERFWSLTRRFGWWRLAYLEAVLRLADQQASAAEDAGDYENIKHHENTNHYRNTNTHPPQEAAT